MHANFRAIAGVTLAMLMTLPLTVHAANAEKAIEACKVAITAERGEGAKTKVKKIKPRGGNYEAWLNISEGDSQFKTYCSTKRGKVNNLVTSEGRWTSSNPKRPETEPKNS